MDPLSITTAVLSITKLCISSIGPLATWIGDIKGIAKTIEGFQGEIETLAATLDCLKDTITSIELNFPNMGSEQGTCGRLLVRVSAILGDCEATMDRLGSIFAQLDKHRRSNKVRAIRQFRYELKSGEVACLRQRILHFNSTLALPLQLLTVSLLVHQNTPRMPDDLFGILQRLEQLGNGVIKGANAHGPTPDTQVFDWLQQLEFNMAQTQAAIEVVTEQLSPTPPGTAPDQPQNQRYSFVDLSEDNRAEERAVYDNLKECVTSVRELSSSVSSAASARSATTSGTLRPAGTANQSPFDSFYTRASVYGVPLSQESRENIEAWIPQRHATPSRTVPSSSQDLSGKACSTGSVRTDGTDMTEPTDSEDDDAIDPLLLKAYIDSGQTKFSTGNYELAEAAFRKALSRMETLQTYTTVAITPDDIRLLLSEACFRQRKLAEAIETATHVANRTSDPSDGNRLAAAHLLAQIYMEQGDLVRAEQHALTAKKGDEVEVEAWQTLLPNKAGDGTYILPNKKPTPARNASTADHASGHPRPSHIPNPAPMGESLRKKTMHPSAPASVPVHAAAPGDIRKDENSARWTPVQEEMAEHQAAWAEMDEDEQMRWETADVAPQDEMKPPTSEDTSRTPENKLNGTTEEQLTSRQQSFVYYYQRIEKWCAAADHDRAVRMAMRLLRLYHYGDCLVLKAAVGCGSKISMSLPVRSGLSEAIRSGGESGLVSTATNKCAAIHFFAALPGDYQFEVKHLLENGAKANTEATLAEPLVDNRHLIRYATPRMLAWMQVPKEVKQTRVFIRDTRAIGKESRAGIYRHAVAGARTAKTVASLERLCLNLPAALSRIHGVQIM
ncbi:hypothetical protein H2203_003859 [Taxawa tesnikishii (nom. ined.)]|nr:hypothetical protein H2203_003859 [Dothideales sp. JES 119]